MPDGPPRVLVVGGAGFVGQTLARQLAAHGLAPAVFDCAPSSTESTGYVGDMTNAEDVTRAFAAVRPAACVHLASWGMSGSPMLSPACLRINVEGTVNVLAAAQQANCRVVVYLSTYNVCYGGNPIVGGDESTPLFDAALHTDYYSRSKALAEQKVREADRSKCSDGTPLRTCVLRPAAIYGPGEARHFPRIVAHMEAGLFSLFSLGSPASLVDWVHADHVAQACRLAVEKLLAGDEQPAGGVYFISDGTPINNFEFLRPLAKGLHAPFPRLALPTSVAICLAHAAELLYHWFGVDPLLTRAEVFKVANTHYFSIAAAQQDLGYQPVCTSQQGAEQMAAYYAGKPTNARFFRHAALHSPLLALAVTAGLAVLGVLALEDPAAAPPFSWGSPMTVLRAIGYLIFRNQAMLQAGFIAAIAAHVGEALYACHVARALGCETWPWWGLQTLWLGYGSLRWLLARRRHLRAARKAA